MRQRKVVFRTGPIQVPIIHTHSHLPIPLRDWYDVGNPLWVPSDSQKPSVKLFLYLFFYFQGCLGLHPPQFFVLLGNTRGLGVICVVQYQNSNRAYVGTTKQRCLGSLFAGLLILHGWVRSYPCLSLLPFFHCQFLSLLVLSLLDEAPFLGPHGRLSFPTPGEVPHPRSLHLLFDSFLARNRWVGPRY